MIKTGPNITPEAFNTNQFTATIDNVSIKNPTQINRILADSGNNTAPSYSFSLDDNTGIYNPADGVLGMALNSNPSFYFYPGKIVFNAGVSPTGEGDLSRDVSRNAFGQILGGSRTYIPGIRYSSTEDATVTNTTTETTLLANGSGDSNVGAAYLVVGKLVRITVVGYYSTAATPGTLTIRFKIGSTTVVSTPSNTPTGSLSLEFFKIEIYCTCRSTGTTGTVRAVGAFQLNNGPDDYYIWNMVSPSTTTIDTTVTQLYDVTAQWGTASPSNAITATNSTVEFLR